MSGGRARSTLGGDPGARFVDVRWVAETESTNADLMALARAGAPEGVVLVADHQTAGRGRAGRTWSAPPGASLLCSILFRPPVDLMDLSTMVVALAAAEALEAIGGFVPRLKWPNDLVWPGDGSVDDRKLAGILAEADWPGTAPDAAEVSVVVGIGINVDWPADLPHDLADIAVACNHICATTVDREDLLIAMLRRLDVHYATLIAGDRASVLDRWRARSATLGRLVRVDLGHEELVGTATDLTDSGHLVVATSEGPREVAVGDVVHLRPG
ncbi:MAG: biotin--[acetyl-CoA-carboxylase] ligase [Acidimicrobiales bacterium]